MAILNLTPDSFYDGGRYDSIDNVVKKVEQYKAEGADILDIGAYSSRPGAKHISKEEEGKRLFPVLQEIRKCFPNFPISIDTFRSEIAQKSIDLGANIINDISGGEMDDEMYSIIAKNKIQYILMHIKGIPQTMQQNLSQDDIVNQVKNYFQNKLEILDKIGVNDVILDVGFGFGKTLDQNYQLLKHLNEFKSFNKYLLVGISRKSMLYKLLNAEPKNMLNATSVVHTLALVKGANILRVHDVKEAKEVIEIVKKYSISI
jgi:dihydropteroate synthase